MPLNKDSEEEPKYHQCEQDISENPETEKTRPFKKILGRLLLIMAVSSAVGTMSTRALTIATAGINDSERFEPPVSQFLATADGGIIDLEVESPKDFKHQDLYNEYRRQQDHYMESLQAISDYLTDTNENLEISRYGAVINRGDDLFEILQPAPYGQVSGSKETEEYGIDEPVTFNIYTIDMNKLPDHIYFEDIHLKPMVHYNEHGIVAADFLVLTDDGEVFRLNLDYNDQGQVNKQSFIDITDTIRTKFGLPEGETVSDVDFYGYGNNLVIQTYSLESGFRRYHESQDKRNRTIETSIQDANILDEISNGYLTYSKGRLLFNNYTNGDEIEHNLTDKDFGSPTNVSILKVGDYGEIYLTIEYVDGTIKIAELLYAINSDGQSGMVLTYIDLPVHK